MSKLLRFLGVFTLFVFSSVSIAAEKSEVCIKYKKGLGWSKGYAVEGTVVSGSNLNSAVDQFSRFKLFSTYVVVFWDEDQASIFELPRSTLGRVPMLREIEVEDQEGRKWKMKKGHFRCI